MGISHTTPSKNPKKGTVKNLSPSKDYGIAIGDDPDDVWNSTRTACVNSVLKTFKAIKAKDDIEIEYKYTPEISATKYENLLYNKYSLSLNAYKLRFRKDLIALKNPKTKFAFDLMIGYLEFSDFVNLNEKDLISKSQKEKNTKLLDDQLKNKMGKQFPTNINQIKNQNVFVSEKWGISESAAKIDPEFDLD
ncbi:hypothetical protein C6P40_003491 [Pichia californica]|uniref:TFIIS central domain-containing protein n=1 Tax=Pichia californica TaxID=460514 RepID=A0A9P6WQI4_9ASCO|nr:hypothetical protein C6P40_003491 [[Candida] californica]